VLLAVVLAGSALRLHALGKFSLWADELFSADVILQRPLVPSVGAPWFQRIDIHALRDGGNESFWTVKAADQSPPMFELVAKLVTAVAGSSEAGLRLTSALAAIAALMWLALRAWRARAGPLLPVYLTVLVLAAFNGLMIFYAREARAYALGAALITVLALRFWERGIAGWHRAPLPGWGEIALCVAACMTHYDALVVTGLLLLPCAWQALRRKDIAALARLAVVAVFVVAWPSLNYDNIVHTAAGQMGWYHGSISRAFKDMLAQRVIGPWLASLMALAVIAAMAAAMRRRQPDGAASDGLDRASIAVAAVLLAAIGVTLLIAKRTGIVNERHLIFALQLLFILTGSCLALVARRWRGAVWTFLILATAAQLPLAGAALTKPKDNYRDAAAFVLERLQPGDALVTLIPATLNYYLDRSDKRFERKSLLVREQAPELCAELTGRQRIGLYGHAYALPLATAMKDICGDRYSIDLYQGYNMFAAVWTKK